MQRKNKTFKILHGEVSFTPQQMEYYEIRARFEKLASECRQQAKKEFYNRFHDYSEMINGVDAWIKEYLMRGATLAAQVLADHEHYDLDPERFVEEYFDNSRLAVAAAHMWNFANAQEAEHQALEAERNARTEAAGDAWVGGGFGLEGAIKGAVQAEALNLAGAAISETFNNIGRKSESKRQKQEQDAFFADRQTATAFADGIYCGLANMFIDLFKYVDEKCPEIDITYLTKEDVSKSISLLSNMNKGIIPEAKIEEQCRRILAMNPLFPEAYDYISEKFPDEAVALSDMATFFKVQGFFRTLSKKLDKFYATLNVESEKNAWKAQKEMAAFAAKIGLKDYKDYPPLEEAVAEFDRKYRTVEGIEYETRELADKQKELFEFFKSLGLAGKYSEIEAAMKKVHAKAAKLGVDDGWLNERWQAALDASQERAKSALDEFFATLTIDTEEQALAAKKALAEKAAELELHGYTAYPVLEQKLAEFDKLARTAGPRIFETREEARLQRGAYEFYRASDLTASEEKALAAKRELENIAKRDSIDVGWLIADVDVALKHYDDIARMAFGYRYESREERQRVGSDEALFFLAVWSEIGRFVKRNGLKAVGDYGADVLGTARRTLGLENDTPIVAYINTEMITSGNSGLAFTPKGIYWSNGSVLLTKIASNKFVKALFSKKASELEEKNKVQAFSVTWKDFLTSKAPLEGAGAGMIQLADGLSFEASRINVDAFKAMLTQLRAWAQSTSIEFSAGEVPFAADKLQYDVAITPLPVLK